MTKQTPREQFTGLVGKISDDYFIDVSEQKVDQANPIQAWNTTLLLLAHAFKDNILILGEPGFGKTTGAKIVSAIGTGLPFDLYEAAQLQGHPEQTKEELVARPDYAQLSSGEEKVIWQLGAHLPAVILDEFNRLPQGKQSALLNWMATGRATYLNETVFQGKVPFYATANHPDDGNHIIIPPMADRFATTIEAGYIGPGRIGEIRKAEERIRKELCSTELTDLVMGLVHDKSVGIKNVMQKVEKSKQAKEFRQKLNELELQADLGEFVKQVEAMEFTPEALIFYDTLEAELNYNGKKGPKRSNEALVADNHTKELAGTKFKNAASPRAMLAIERYSKAVAYLTGSDKVEKRHIVAAAPHVLRHRLQFTDDFKAEHEEKDRTAGTAWYNAPSEELYLAETLLRVVDKNYMASVHPHLALLHQFVKDPAQLTSRQRQDAADMVRNAASLDHPLLKHFAYEAKKYLGL